MTQTPDTLITTYLHMTSPDQLKAAFLDRPDLMMLTITQPDLAYYRFLYGTIGEAWRWRDRLIMPDEELLSILSQPTNRVDVLMVGGVPAGYVELAQHGSRVEVAYFGLRPGFIGQGLGKHLLSHGVQTAWTAMQGCDCVWVHTCNLDSPHAMPNYQARGFKIYDVVKTPMPELYL